MGSILTVSNGTWSPTPSRYSYQWLRDGHPIRNATGSSYRLKRTDQGKRISATVTATRKGYSAATATAAPVGPIVKTVLIHTKAPAISAHREGRLDAEGVDGIVVAQAVQLLLPVAP